MVSLSAAELWMVEYHKVFAPSAATTDKSASDVA